MGCCFSGSQHQMDNLAKSIEYNGSIDQQHQQNIISNKPMLDWHRRQVILRSLYNLFQFVDNY